MRRRRPSGGSCCRAELPVPLGERWTAQAHPVPLRVLQGGGDTTGQGGQNYESGACRRQAAAPRGGRPADPTRSQHGQPRPQVPHLVVVPVFDVHGVGKGTAPVHPAGVGAARGQADVRLRLGRNLVPLRLHVHDALRVATLLDVLRLRQGPSVVLPCQPVAAQPLRSARLDPHRVRAVLEDAQLQLVSVANAVRLQREPVVDEGGLAEKESLPAHLYVARRLYQALQRLCPPRPNAAAANGGVRVGLRAMRGGPKPQ
mmetsp:Transcript_65202/g.174338  ORF Transcript_65202/g.174338 Transcript_65202/m.174338 type:complete len:258 (-) Transcript_65202:235-1008(-)